MERVKIKVSLREGRGKEIVKKLRKQGFIPAVVYSNDVNTVLNIPVEGLKVLRSIHFSESTIIDMDITGEKDSLSMPVFIKDVQFNPLTEAIDHIDFLKVSLTEKIRVNIPIILKGEAKAVKEAEGVVEQILRELEVEGFPLDIPEHVDLDISGLEIGRSIHVEQLKVPENIKIISEVEEAVVTALAKQEEVEVEAAAEGIPSQEPEVIKEKKEVPEGSAKEAKPKEAKEGKPKEGKGTPMK
ncbi:MAG: 50S ribosomal protein L25 [Candidatus Omnitrophica bacterium]|nr:50S ribosomal protein L25 [Candidatus Omnitrophota bacterium]